MENPDEALQHAFPIYKPDDPTGDRPAIQGSLVWVAIGELHYAVTANHVLDQTDGSTLYWPGGHELIVAKEDMARTSEPPYADYKRDPVDLAIFRLTSEQCDWLTSSGKKPMPITDWAYEKTNLPGRPYTFVGYPSSKLKVSFSAKSMRPGPHTFTCGGVAADKISTYGWRPDLHLVAHFKRDAMHKGDGVQMTAPEPYGMSGGPVMAVDAGSGQVHMVGVGIYYDHEKHYLVGTRITAAFAIFRQAFPETRGFLGNPPDPVKLPRHG